MKDRVWETKIEVAMVLWLLVKGKGMRCELFGRMSEQGLLMDFVAVWRLEGRMAKRYLKYFEERMGLPIRNDRLRWSRKDFDSMCWGKRRWI